MGSRLKLVAVALVLLAALGISPQRTQAQAQSSSPATPADYLKWRNELKNWGRWGADDDRGASNLITPAKSLSAAKLVKSGIVVSLAHAVPMLRFRRLPSSTRTTNGITTTNTTDTYSVSYHGLGVSHMDAFCHFFYEGKMFNGFSVADNISPETGCKKGSIMAWRDGVVTRAVFYDIPQLKGVEYVEPGTPITRVDLEAWERKSGVKAVPGDVILLYVGRWKRRAAKGPQAGMVAGYHPDVIPFIKERDLAFIGHDFNIDWNPRPGWGAEEGIPVNPVHQAVLNWMGVSIIENLDLEKAAETARRLKRYEFMISIAPLPVEGGTGSPINPLATF